MNCDKCFRTRAVQAVRNTSKLIPSFPPRPVPTAGASLVLQVGQDCRSGSGVVQSVELFMTTIQTRLVTR